MKNMTALFPGGAVGGAARKLLKKRVHETSIPAIKSGYGEDFIITQV